MWNILKRKGFPILHVSLYPHKIIKLCPGGSCRPMEDNWQSCVGAQNRLKTAKLETNHGKTGTNHCKITIGLRAYVSVGNFRTT